MPALRRAVALGDAWYPFGSNPKFRMDRLETYTARLAILHRLAEEFGRDPKSIALAYNCAFHSATLKEDEDGNRQTFTGSGEERAQDFYSFGQVGLQTVIVNVSATNKSAMLERMTEFSQNVMPLVK